MKGCNEVLAVNKLNNLHSLRSFGRAKDARPFEMRYAYLQGD